MIVALMPARGGSKRLPRKNVHASLAGRDLPAHGIQTGKEADLRRRLAQCDRQDISLFFMNRDCASGHSSGEYGF